MKVSSAPRERGFIASYRAARLATLALMLGGCGDAPDHEAETARRARQMRDVARMLDAMESTDPIALATLAASPPTHADSAPGNGATHDVSGSDRATGHRWPWSFLAGGGAVATLLAVLLRRRRRDNDAPAPSVAPFFADAPAASPPPAPVAPASPPAAPTWIYRKTSFETPGLHMIPSAVDLLVPRRPVPADPVPDATSLRALLADAAGSQGPFLIGDPHFPRLRRADATGEQLLAWCDLLRAQLDDDGDDGRLARWLMPTLEMEMASDLPPRDAVRRLADIEADALARSAPDQASRIASLVPLRLARIERLSGATRLFAVRALAVELSGACNASSMDARIDVLLAWSSWSLAATAAARLDDADAAAHALAALDSSSGRARHRLGEIRWRRAALRRPGDALADLDAAQRLLDEAYGLAPTGETALLAARIAERRARLLPPHEAAAVCSDALVHAFLAEQEPPWRSDALACRRDIQRLYESLPPLPSPTNDESS